MPKNGEGIWRLPLFQRVFILEGNLKAEGSVNLLGSAAGDLSFDGKLENRRGFGYNRQY